MEFFLNIAIFWGTYHLKICMLLDETRSWAEKVFTDSNLPSLMPDKDNNFGGSLVSDFRKWWRHLQPKNSSTSLSGSSLYNYDLWLL